jgi:hypothetical protein
VKRAIAASKPKGAMVILKWRASGATKHPET